MIMDTFVLVLFSRISYLHKLYMVFLNFLFFNILGFFIFNCLFILFNLF